MGEKGKTLFLSCLESRGIQGGQMKAPHSFCLNGVANSADPIPFLIFLRHKMNFFDDEWRNESHQKKFGHNNRRRID